MRRLFILVTAVCVVCMTRAQDVLSLPGVVVAHCPADCGKYIGSPSIAVLPDGSYVASHDEFGPKSAEYKSGITFIYRSTDGGATWNKIARIEGAFWSTLFVNGNALYLMGTNKAHGNVVIRRSTDGGVNWSVPSDPQNGLLVEGEYHTAPTPVIVAGGRVWRAVEYATGKSVKWPERYSAVMLSAPSGSDLLDAGNWTRSESFYPDMTWLDGGFKGWLEGNAVACADGSVADVLRVHVGRSADEYCAVLKADRKGRRMSFRGLYPMNGGSKKFTIRYDDVSGRYWSILNYVGSDCRDLYPDRVRNRLVLASSENLETWTMHRLLVFHPDVVKHGFQYVDWVFDGDDVVYVARTAFDEPDGTPACNYHNANYMTFGRVSDFRNCINECYK